MLNIRYIRILNDDFVSDINECQTTSTRPNCAAGKECRNLYGSHSCECPFGQWLITANGNCSKGMYSGKNCAVGFMIEPLLGRPPTPYKPTTPPILVLHW